MKCKLSRALEKKSKERWKATSERKRRSFKGRRSVPCAYCKVPLSRSEATGDHVQPISAGGSNKMKNLVIACVACNSRKGSLSVSAFKALQREQGY